MPPDDPTQPPDRSAADGANDADGNGILLTDTTNLLDSAEPGGRVLRVLPSGTRGRVTGGPVESGNLRWLRITTNLGDGWVMADWVTPDQSDQQPFAPGTRLMTTAAVNLRGSHAVSSEVIYLIPSGSEVTVLDGPVSNHGFEWYHVRSVRYGAGWMVSIWMRVAE